MHTFIHGTINHDYQGLSQARLGNTYKKIGVQYIFFIILQVAEQENWRVEENAPIAEIKSPSSKNWAFLDI